MDGVAYLQQVVNERLAASEQSTGVRELTPFDYLERSWCPWPGARDHRG